MAESCGFEWLNDDALELFRVVDGRCEVVENIEHQGAVVCALLDEVEFWHSHLFPPCDDPFRECGAEHFADADAGVEIALASYGAVWLTVVGIVAAVEREIHKLVK